jgi:hypothetical protein
MNADVYCLKFDRAGDLYVGGSLTTAGTNASVYLARALLGGRLQNQLSLTSLGSGTNSLTFLGTPGAQYALELASNRDAPMNWLPLGTKTAGTNDATTAGYLFFTSVNILPEAYYRMRHVP